MRKFARIKLDVRPVEFYCPECESIIFTSTDMDEKPIPNECPSCGCHIDTSGVTLYKGPINHD
jgi:predicted RNA-binding Zn-ribbon protein involved in translation (DUF1610 family)